MTFGFGKNGRVKDPELVQAWKEIDEFRLLVGHLPPPPPPPHQPDTIAQAQQDMNELMRLATE